MSDGESGGQRGKAEPTLIGPPQNSLLTRLTSGIGSVAEADRVAYATDNDDRAWKNHRLCDILERVHSGHIAAEYRSDLPGACQDLAELLSGPDSEHLVRALLHHPEHLLGVVLPDLLRPKEIKGETKTERNGRKEGAQASALYVWSVFTVCVEVLWQHVSSKVGSAHRHLEPLAARTRFLALTEPFRHQPDESKKSLNWVNWWQGESLQHLFGDSDTWVPLIRKARESRDVWREYLNQHQSLPLFDHASPLAIEEEIHWLTYKDPKSRQTFFANKPIQFTLPTFVTDLLVLSGPETETDEEENRKITPPEPTAADRAVLIDMVERHLLPRFAVAATWSAVCSLYQSTKLWAVQITYTILLLTLMAALGAVPLALCTETEWTSTGALITIGLFYCIIGFSTLFYGRAWAMPLLLRLPASGAVGLILLVTFHPSWWERVGKDWWLYAVLGGAALWYLLIEVRNHNTGMILSDTKVPFILTGRALAVALTGLVHSLFVALVGMVIITTTFGEKGDDLREIWAQSPEGNFTAILAAATFWCLAAGVFSQILWDDQPITAPLSHRRWRNER